MVKGAVTTWHMTNHMTRHVTRHVTVWRWPCGGDRVAVTVWRWPCGGHMTCHVTWKDNPLRVTAYEWYYREKKITLAEICEITEVCHNAEDLNYKKVLKHYLPAAYKEFKDIFSKK